MVHWVGGFGTLEFTLVRPFVRPSVRSFVRPFGTTFLSNHPLDFSEILHEVVTTHHLKSDIPGFLKKNLVGPLGDQKGSKMPQKGPKWPKMALFAP